MKLLDYLNEEGSRWTKTAGCLLISLLVGVADYFTRDISLMMFYFVPIAIASWYIGKRTSIFISFVCGAELFLTDRLVHPEFLSIFNIRSWNAIIEISYLVLTGYLLSKVKLEIEQRNQRTKELEIANFELEAFNYTVAHDLRKPLTVINGYCQAIKELCGDKFDEKCTRYLQEAYDGTWRMNRLIDTLLNFSHLTHIELRRESIDLSRLAQDVAAELEHDEPERRVTFRITPGIAADGDPNLLRVLLENLLGNAWKYTGKRENAVIEFGETEIDGTTACFIRDNGLGFDMANAEKLFFPFRRLAGTEDSKGFGIGLATVERIIRRHGGKVWAEGEPGKGATFYFTLPSVVTTATSPGH